ncbi:MAG: patatin-like phospholipase family protein [Chloroflexota bacterium]
MKIGLALSGGGYRASVFHLGMLARLSEEGWLEDVKFISSVSGGSLVTGLIFQANGNQWPTSADYIEKVLPEAFRLLTTYNLQANVILDTLLKPLGLLTSRAKIVSRNLSSHWGIVGNLTDLPEEPRWVINATCYETGRLWRFEHFRMGDYIFGYTFDPQYPISEAIAASAGLPVAIGTMAVKTNRYRWVKYKENSTTETEPLSKPLFRKVHLWDGGVYDNLGLEPLVNYNNQKGEYAYRAGVDYLIASNASGIIVEEKYVPWFKAIVRLISIPKYQVEALRSRDMIHRFIHHQDKGQYFKMGNSCRKLLGDIDRPGFDLEETANKFLSKDIVDELSKFPTTIRKLSVKEFSQLFRHGYEVADCTLYKHENNISLRTYNNDKWKGILTG